MKICIIGKYPPVQGGVSMRTYWAAHELAKLGHTVHVVTNANEAKAPHRMFMREEDWARCNAQYAAGSVQVHWTDPYGARQSHIPQGTPFVTKLASIALELAREHAIEILYSYYTEPYSIAAHIVAQSLGIPHVARTAGSDAGRLWSLPQFTSLYSEIYRSADAVITNPAVAPKMVSAGVSPSRLGQDPESLRLDQLFTPDGPQLDVEGLRRDVLGADDPDMRSLVYGDFNPALSYFGIYGKLGRAKGTYALLDAIKELKEEGLPVGVLVLAHEFPASDVFRQEVAARALEDRICQLPFIPHWRVPELIRRCLAVCCLEQDFPIKFHTPMIAREVLTCGGCLVGSMEVIQKLPTPHKLVDGYNCVAVTDVNDIQLLKSRLRSVFEQPERVQEMKRRARKYGVMLDRDNTHPSKLERILSSIAETGQLSPESIRPIAPDPTHPAANIDSPESSRRIRKSAASLPAPAAPGSLEPFSRLRAALAPLDFKDKMALLDAMAATANSSPALKVASALKMDLLTSEKNARRKKGAGAAGKDTARVFRLDQTAGFFDESAFDEMVPQACEQYGFVEVPADVTRDDPAVIKSFAHKKGNGFGGDGAASRLCAIIPEEETHAIRIVDAVEAALLKSCDGSKSVGELCASAAEPAPPDTVPGAELRKRMLHLFQIGLIKLTDGAALRMKRA